MGKKNSETGLEGRIKTNPHKARAPPENGILYTGTTTGHLMRKILLNNEYRNDGSWIYFDIDSEIPWHFAETRSKLHDLYDLVPEASRPVVLVACPEKIELDLAGYRVKSLQLSEFKILDERPRSWEAKRREKGKAVDYFQNTSSSDRYKENLKWAMKERKQFQDLILY